MSLKPAAPAAAPAPAAPADSNAGGGEGKTVALMASNLSELAVVAAFQAARARLVVANDAIKLVLEMKRIQATVGRKAAPEIDFVIDHAAVSSTHSRIRFEKQRFFLEDLGSKNGTFIGQEMLSPNAPRELRPESHVRFGGIDALFVIDVDATGQKMSPAKYKAAADLLENERKITKVQRQAAEKELADKTHGERHIGEVLLLKGLVSVEQWTDALKRADLVNLVATTRPSGGGAGKLIAVFIVLLGIAAALFLLKDKIFK